MADVGVDPRTVLDTPLPEGNDAGAATIRDYLVRLLTEVWTQGSCFSGKYGLGDSDWQWNLLTALVRAGHITGRIDDDGYVEDLDREAGDRLIAAAIQSLGSGEEAAATSDQQRLAQLRAYAHWCKTHAVEPDERDLLAIADGSHDDYVALTAAEQEPAREGCVDHTPTPNPDCEACSA